MMDIRATAGAERRSLAEEAYAAIKAEIVTSRLPPGAQRLEEELAAQLGMSRTPVREALIRLEREGFLELVPRRGARIRTLTKRDVREITEVLNCLESQAAERLASRKLPAADMARLEQAIAGMDVALAAEDMDAWAEADYAFHRLLIELCGNRHLEEVAMNFLEKAHRFRLLTMPYRTRPVYSNVNHAAVVEAIRRADAQTAVEIHRAHKRRWARELAEILERIDLPE
jgi:DNA-binding GntR family transcriptional regulator